MASKDELSDIGLIGLAVMGQNLVLNMNDQGYQVSVFNRTTSKVDEFLSNEALDTKVVGCHSLETLVASLKCPRRIIVLVKAGPPVDGVLKQLVPLLKEGDIVIDGGNSEYTDTMRREEWLRTEGKLFVGSGVSGGEEGARRGPSLMPGGDPRAWPHIKEIFQSIAAKVDGQPCCDWVGKGGSGHFVKMVHNGIEYADMQVVCECFQLLHSLLSLSHPECAQVYADWNEGELESFLIELTRDILQTTDDKGVYVVDSIYDAAGQKGTGKWTVMSSIKHRVPLTLIAEAVNSRFISSLKPQRVAASKILQPPPAVPKFSEKEKLELIEHIRKALYMTKIICYTQGYMLLKEASEAHDWELNYGGIALMWRGGCIIRSKFLGDIKKAFEADVNLTSLLTQDFFKEAVNRCSASLQKVVEMCDRLGFPVPALSSALSFHSSYHHHQLSFPHPLLASLYAKRSVVIGGEDKTEADRMVKMLHKAVEYADMQMTCECVQLLHSLLHLTHPQCAQVMQGWTESRSGLLQDTIDFLLLPTLPPLHPNSTSDRDEGQNAITASLDYGVPFTTITSAVYSRYLKDLKREQVSPPSVAKVNEADKAPLIENLRKALYAAKIILYSQAFMLLKKASETNDWKLNLADVSSKWNDAKGNFMVEIKKAFETEPSLSSLLTAAFFKDALVSSIPSLREISATTRIHHQPTPTLSSALAFYEAYRSEKLPHNLLQALRDYFGAHMYSTLEQPDVFVHTDWSGRGGRVTSTAYNS